MLHLVVAGFAGRGDAEQRLGALSEGEQNCGIAGAARARSTLVFLPYRKVPEKLEKNMS